MRVDEDGWTRANVGARVATEFPAAQAEHVLAILDQYRGDTPAGRARVQLAILALAGGDVAKVAEYTADAQRDFRDVLFQAGLPPRPST